MYASRQLGQGQPSVYEDYNVLKLHLRACQHLSLTGHSYLKDTVRPLIYVMAPPAWQILNSVFSFPLTRPPRFRNSSWLVSLSAATFPSRKEARSNSSLCCLISPPLLDHTSENSHYLKKSSLPSDRRFSFSFCFIFDVEKHSFSFSKRRLF